MSAWSSTVLGTALRARYAGMWLLAANTGMRRSERAGVARSMLDLERGTPSGRVGPGRRFAGEVGGVDLSQCSVVKELLAEDSVGHGVDSLRTRWSIHSAPIRLLNSARVSPGLASSG